MRLPFRLHAFPFIAAAVVFVFGLLLLDAQDHVRDAAENAQQAQAAERAITRALFYLAAVEAGQRSYLLTGDSSYLEQYRTAIPRLERNIAQLKRLAQTPTERTLTARLDSLVDERLEVAAHAIELRRGEGLESALEFVQAGRGKALMDTARATAVEMLSRERTLVEQREAAEARRAVRLQWIILLGTLVSAVGAFATNWLIGRHAAARDAAAQDLAASNELLSEQAVELEMQAAELQESAAVIEESEIRFRQLAANIPQVFWISSLDKNEMIYVSDAFEDVWGRPPAELLNEPKLWLEVLHPDDRERVLAALPKQSVGTYDEEYRIVRPYGETRWIRDRAFPIRNEEGRVYRVAGIAEDVTERKRAEAELHASEERYRSLVESSPDMIGVHRQGRILFINETGAKMLGAESPGQIVGRSMMEFVHPDYQQFVIERMRQMQEEGHALPPAEEKIVRLDGEVLDVEVTGRPVVYEGGPASQLVVHDITSRKKAEEAVRDSEERWRALVEYSADLTLTLGADGTITYVAPSVERLLGYAPEELIGTSGFDHVHPEDLSAIKTTFAELLRTPATIIRAEFRYRHKDGSWRILVARGRNLLDHPVIRGIVINGRDATQQRQTEEQFRQAQKMEAVGRLAGGVAHDFNNLLTSIRGFAQMAADDLGADHRVQDDLQEVIRGAERASALTRQLLAFSRQQVLRPQAVRLNAVVEESTKMLGRLVGEDVEFRTRLAPDLGEIVADPSQVEQVILNLVVNARDAMPEGGTLTLATENVELSDEYTKERYQVTPGPYVMLSVSDTGHGMTREVQERIFEPFFTTKEQGKGTGLGLSTVFGIVKQSDGYVWVYSEPDQGTTFRVYFPRAGAVSPAPEHREAARERRGANGETVLLVEDEDAVRAFARRVLERKGYIVLEAGSGEEALDLIEAYTGRIDLILTDVVMPGMSGTALAARVGEINGAIRVLFTSGYPREEIGGRGTLLPGMAFLEKPYTPGALADTIRDLLEG